MKTIPLQFLSELPITNGLGLSGAHDDRSWPRYVRTTDIASPTSLRDDTFASQPPDAADDALLAPGDVLMTAAGATIGKSTTFNENYPACYAGFLVRVRPRSTATGRFLTYWMQSLHYWDQINAGAVRSTIDNFSAGKYRKIHVPALGDHAYDRIADYLDHETAKIDTLIAKQEALIATLAERRQALVDLAFAASAATHRLQLGRLLRVRPTYGVLVPQYVDADPGVSLVRVGDLDKLAAGSRLRQISVDQSAEYSRTILTGGEVLLGVVGNMGRAVVAPHWLEGANVVRAIAVLRCLEPTQAPLLATWFSSTHFLNQAELATSGDSVQPTLGMGDLAHFTIEWPASQAILTATWHDLEAQTAKIDTLLAKTEQFVALTRERRAALITAAVTGDVSPRA